MHVDSPQANDAVSPARLVLHAAQQRWREVPIAERVQIVRRARHRVANHAEQLASAIVLPQRRGAAESIAAEVFPLADAMRFLERNAPQLLAPKSESNRDRPAWGRGLRVVTHRDPLGIVLVIGTWNYPLFLTGVQLVQAITAGNAVIIKPGVGCLAVTKLFVDLLVKSGLPSDLVSLRSEDAEAAQQAIQDGVDKAVFTGSASTGRTVMRQLASSGTPSVMELSGSDAVFVLPSADLNRVARCVAFGLQINGGATCIAPRRVFTPRASIDTLKTKLLDQLSDVDPVPVYDPAGTAAADLICNSQHPGATLLWPASWPGWKPGWKVGQAFPITVLEVEIEKNPHHPILHSDLFAPVISLIPCDDMEAALRYDSDCPYALGASVFGQESTAKKFAQQVDAGCVVINDIVAPTADPRVAFGGRHRSGFGTTRGAAGLLEMTQLKSVVTQTSSWLPHLDKPIPELGPMLIDFMGMSHGAGWKEKWQAMLRLAKSGRAYWNASKKNKSQHNS